MGDCKSYAHNLWLTWLSLALMLLLLQEKYSYHDIYRWRVVRVKHDELGLPSSTYLQIMIIINSCFSPTFPLLLKLGSQVAWKWIHANFQWLPPHHMIDISYRMILLKLTFDWILVKIHNLQTGGENHIYYGLFSVYLYNKFHFYTLVSLNHEYIFDCQI